VEFRHQFKKGADSWRIRLPEILISSVEYDMPTIEHDGPGSQTIEQVFVVGDESTGSNEAWREIPSVH
jgi:hypothetical protein